MTDPAKMSDKEINALVAEKVMGAQTFRVGLPAGTLVMFSGSPLYTERARFEPSTDIDHAWSVVDHVLASRHVRFATLHGSHMQPFAEFFDVATGHQRFAASADTMPRAICLSALAAVREEQ